MRIILLFLFQLIILNKTAFAFVSAANIEHAEPNLTLSDNLQSSDLSYKIEILEETKHDFSIDEIKTGKIDSLFLQNKLLGSGTFNRSVWARIKIKSTALNRRNWIIQTSKYYSEVFYYAIYPDDNTILQKSGWSIPINERSIENSSVIFDLPLKFDEAVTIYLHVRADLRFTNFSKVEAEIYPLSEWQKMEQHKWMIQGIYSGLCLLCIFFWFMNYYNSLRTNYLYMIFSTFGVSMYMLDLNGITTTLFWPSNPWYFLTKNGQTLIWLPFAFLSVGVLGLKILQLKKYFPKKVKYFLVFGICTAFSTVILSQFISWKLNAIISGILMISWFVFVLIISVYCWRKKVRGATSTLTATSPFFICFTFNAIFGYGWRPGNQSFQYVIQTGCTIFTVFILFSMAYYLNTLRKKRFLEQKEKEQMIINQNILLEQKVEERTIELKETQNQMIQQEKLAYLGQMTSGIAHEIQNPLNFVNNFSSLSKELLIEYTDLKSEKDKQDIFQLLDDNLTKIEYHGKRADSIIKSMLMHSRTGKKEKKLTDINNLCEEAISIAFHSIKSKIAGYDCKIETFFENDLPPIIIIPQDISRVILNLVNNAFYAMINLEHVPVIEFKTEKLNHSIIISIKDNGNGVPEDIQDKIFQPFFTTKATGEGTGLGLSISYDIVRAHGGEIKIKNEGGALFQVVLPIV